MWLGKYPLADDTHTHDLERSAALHEFHGGMTRDQAEASAYQKYKVLQHQKAAAHHLNGLKNAKQRGNIAEGQRHYIMYCSHAKELGVNPNAPVPPEISTHLNEEASDKYQEHGADSFILNK